MPALWQLSTPGRGCSPCSLVPADTTSCVCSSSTTSPYLSWWSRWKHIILGVYTSFSYNGAVSWPPEQFSQGNLCQASLSTTTTSNPYSASSAGQLNLCWANPTLLIHIRERKIPFSVQATRGFWIFFFFFLAAKLLTYCCQHHPWFSSIGCEVLTLYIVCTISCFSPFHSETSPLSLCHQYIALYSGTVPKSFRLREITWVHSLQNSLKRDGLVLRTLKPLCKIQQAKHKRTYITLSACSGTQCINLQDNVFSVTAILFFSGRPHEQHGQKQILHLILLHRQMLLINKSKGEEQLKFTTYARS